VPDEPPWQETYAPQIRRTAELVQQLQQDIPARDWVQAAATLDELVANYRVMAPEGTWLEGIMAVCLINAGRVAEVAGRPADAASYLHEAAKILMTVSPSYPHFSKDLQTAFDELQRLKWVNRGLRRRRRDIGEINYMHML
jgi:hypothetical protein